MLFHFSSYSVDITDIARDVKRSYSANVIPSAIFADEEFYSLEVNRLDIWPVGETQDPLSQGTKPLKP